MDRRDPRELLKPLSVARFWTSVLRQPNGGCWEWTGYVNDKGYGTFGTGDTTWQAHVLAYSLVYGPVPVGLTLDHLCHTNDPTCPRGPACLHRRCVHPLHMEPVTLSVNVQRGRAPDVARCRERTACSHGHELTPENTYIRPSGFRDCKECARRRSYRRYIAQKAVS